MKKLMCIFLSAVMLLGLVPAIAMAEEPTYTDSTPINELEIGWGGGEEQQYWYRDNGRQTPLELLPKGVKFDEDTLTLNNADINFIRVMDWGTNKLKINVEGTNSIRAYDGRNGIEIVCSHDVTISGSGTLNIEVVGRNADSENQGFGNYGTPLSAWDCYVVERGENYHGENDHVYPNGNLVIDGVTVNLTNPENEISQYEDDYIEGQFYWSAAHNAQAMNVFMANMKLTGGAKLTGVSMEGMNLTTSLTVESGSELTASSLEINGLHDDIDGRCIETSLTVSGKLTVTGDGYDVVEENREHVRDIYRSSLRINPGATLILNNGGDIQAAAPNGYDGCGVEISAPHYRYDANGRPVELTSPEELGAGHAKINGGTLIVNGARDGINVCSGATWTQTGGTVTVNVDADAYGSGNRSGGITVSGDYDIFLKTAALTQSGGTVNINMDMGEPTEISDEWSADGTEYAPGLGLYGDVTYEMSGDAGLNINYKGTGNGWIPGVHMNPNWDQDGNILGGSPKMSMSGNAAVKVDYTGFKGMDDRTGVAGMSVESQSTLDIGSGATVNVTLPDGDVGGDAQGINIILSKMTTGGNIIITSPETMIARCVDGVSINGETESDHAAFTMNGGEVTIDLRGTVANESIGFWTRDPGTEINFNGGTVNVTAGGVEKGGDDWKSSIGMDAYNGVNIKVGQGATLNFTVLNNNKYNDDNCERLGIKLNEQCTYTQAAGSTVNIDGGGEDDGNLMYTFEGLHVEDRSRVSVNGELTIAGELDAGIILYNRSTLEVGNGAQITYDARNTTMGDGIVASDYSDIIMSGGQIDIDVPIVPWSIDENGMYWMTGGMSIDSNATATVTGGTININQKETRSEKAVDEFQTAGLTVTNGFFRMTGGELNVLALIPVGATNTRGATNPITLGNGICAVYADGTTYGDQNLAGYEVNKYTHTDGSSYFVDNYVLDPEEPDNAQEFGVTIKNQTGIKAAAEYSGLLELVNSGAIIAGQAYTARLTATLPSGSDTVTLSVENGAVQEDSVSVNGEKADATYENGAASLTVHSGDIVRFSVIPGASENTITAKFGTAGKTESASFTAKDYAMELPTSTDKPEVTVSGVAAANTNVQIYVDGSLAASAVANNAGVWSADITLQTEGEHTVYAMIGAYKTGDRTITYYPTLPVVESLTVSNWIHGNTSADPNVETSFTINFVDPEQSTPGKYYTYWPELPEFTFTVKFSQGEDRVADVRVVATDWKGDEETVYLGLNTVTKEWTGTHDFCGNGHITPEQFRVEWRNLKDGSESQTPDTYEEPGIDSKLWGDPEVEGEIFTNPGNTLDERTGRYEVIEVPNGTYTFQVTEGATVTLEAPEDGNMTKEGTSYTVTGAVGDIYIVTVEGGSFEGRDEDVKSLCISFYDSTRGKDADWYVLAETAARDDNADATVGSEYEATGENAGKQLKYLIIKNRVYRLKKDDDKDDTYTIEADATGDENLNIAEVYESFTVSNFESADLSECKLQEWSGDHEELKGTIGSVPATASINYETGEVTIETDTEAIAAEFMQSELGQAVVAAVIDEIEMWNDGTELFKIKAGPVSCDVKVNASFKRSTGELTLTPVLTISVKTETRGHFGTIAETLKLEVSLETVTLMGFGLHMDRQKDAGGGWIPKFNGHFSMNEDVTVNVNVSVAIEGGKDGEWSGLESAITEGTFLNRHLDVEKLVKSLDEVYKRQEDSENLPLIRFYFPLSAIPGLGYYVGDCFYFDYKLLGELGAELALNTGFDTGIVIEHNKIVKKHCDVKPLDVKTTLGFHADAGAGAGIRLDIGAYLFTAVEAGIYGKAGPAFEAKGQGSVTFETNRSPVYDAEIGAELGLKVEAGGVLTLPFLRGTGHDTQGAKFFDKFFTWPDHLSAGKKFMPTKFTKVEREPTIVPAEVNLCNVIDMRIDYQELVGSYDIKTKVLNAEKYEFQLFESDGKPVKLTRDGQLTVTDKSKTFDFWVKLLYKVHEDDEYQIYKVVPLRYSPSVIAVIKTTEGGGPRVATFTVTDQESKNSETKTTTEAGLVYFEAQSGHEYVVTEDTCPPGYFPAVASQTVTAEADENQVKFLNRKIVDPKPTDPKPQSTPNKSMSSCGDPSGFVYEGIESNRLQGVTTTLYKADDSSGANSALWDAKDYDQTNPLETDALGQYLWMVPSSWWQVEYTLAGYDTQHSEWMEVPPVRTGVNQNMTNSSPATASVVYSEALGCYVLKFSRPVQVMTVRDGIGLVLPDGVEGELYGLNPVDADWSVVPAGENSTLCATTFTIDGFEAWKPVYDENGNEVGGEDYNLPVGTNVTIGLADDVLTYMGTSSPATVTTVVMAQPWGKHRVTVINGSGSGTYAAGDTVRVTYDPPRSGFVFDGWDIDSDIEIAIASDGTFIMPDCDVLLTARYKESGGTGGGGGGGGSSAGSNNVTLPESVENGSVTSDHTTAAPGSIVTITVKPNEGYMLSELTVIDSNGKAVTLKDNGDGTYSFTMPDGGVTVKAVFKCAGGVACPSRKFTDLDVTAWYHEYADYVITKGLMDGFGNGIFAPNGTVTRAQMVTVLWNMKGNPTVDYAMSYSDVSDTDWFAQAVRWAASVGVADGYGNGKFGPNDLITREQMATMLYRYELKCGKGAAGGGKSELKFTDAVKVNDWALEAVTWCNAMGIIEGKDNNIFDPSGSAKRCELAAVLSRYDENI